MWGVRKKLIPRLKSLDLSLHFIFIFASFNCLQSKSLFENVAIYATAIRIWNIREFNYLKMEFEFTKINGWSLNTINNALSMTNKKQFI